MTSGPFDPREGRSGGSIPAELSWQGDGHVTDVVLNALADGEDAVVQPSARAHAAECDACSARLAEAALLTLRTGELLASGRTLDSRRRARALPTRAVAVALVIAILGAVPLFLDALAGLPAMAQDLTRAMPVLARSVVVLFRYGSVGFGKVAMIVSWATAGVALVVGILIARAARRKASAGETPVQGGV